MSARAAHLEDAVRLLFLPERLLDLRLETPQILSSVTPADPSGTLRFEGVYGRVYNRVIQSPALRRAAFSLWGSADPLHHLEDFVRDAVEATRRAGAEPVLVDVPSGGGTLLPFLAAFGFRGRVVEVDLAARMLARAVALHRDVARDLDAVFLRADALDLPLRDELADVVVSINGLHVVPDHARFVAEIARVTKSAGSLWLITPVAGPGLRDRAILSAASKLRITPRRPPTLVELRSVLGEAGFHTVHSYGGESITGLACRRA